LCVGYYNGRLEWAMGMALVIPFIRGAGRLQASPMAVSVARGDSLGREPPALHVAEGAAFHPDDLTCEV
jgi:hypothetical protein